MKINNESKKQNKQTGDQQGITLAGRFIPYTWLIGTGGAIVMIALFIGVMVMTGDDNNDASAEPDTEDVVDVEDGEDGEDEPVGDLADEMTEEELAEYEAEVDRMWDEYINDESSDEEPSGDENADDDATEDDATEDEPDETEDTAEEPSVDAVSHEEMVETIKAFLTGYQIYGPGDTSQDLFDRIYPHVTESVANEFVPNREAHGPSIDVTNELVEIRVDAREGVENEYVATIVYTSEAMGEIYTHTDVYSIVTDGTLVSSATIRSAIWE